MTKDRIKEALIPAFITLAVFMGVLFAKGIFPFGSLRIDYYDMGQTNAPLYYHIWDFLHGRGGLFYSWYIDEGQNLSMGSSIQWNISVFNLFFLLIRRSAVMKSLSIFMGLHLFFMAFNMNLLLRHTTDTSRFYRVLFGAAYGLTGFTLTHYTIPTYLDTAALMPLYLITLYDVLTEEKGAGKKIRPVTIYALMTGYMTGLGYYMAFMNLIFILLVGGTYIFVLCGTEHDEKTARRQAVGRAATRLGIGTFAGLGLSSFILMPAAMQMMKSSRFNSNLSGGLFETLHDILWAIGADMYYIKWWLLSGSIAAIVILISGLIRFRKDRRHTIFFFLFCMYPCALIVFESINLLWHMGTYYHYPVRCGYLVPITLLVSAAYYAGRSEHEHMVIRDYNKWTLVAVDFIALAVCVNLIRIYISHDIWPVEELFKAWIIFAVILALIYFVIWCVIKRPVYLSAVLIAELAVAGFIGYGDPHFVDKFSSDPEQSGDYVVTSQTLADSLMIEESRTDRIKNPDTTLNTNYGFIMRRATVGGWANTVPRPQMDSCIALGYGAHFMRILDCGGTLLSDAAFHVTETLTMKPDLYDGDAWEKQQDAEGYTLLKNRYTLPFAMKTTCDSLLSDNSDKKLADMNVDDATNTLYRCLASSGDGGVIMRDITDDVKKGSYHAENLKALYLKGGTFETLTINGKVIPVPDIGDPQGLSYPAWFNSGLLYLGIYEDEDIKADGAHDSETRFYELDISMLETLCEELADEGQEISAGRSSLDITIEGRDGETALIPVAYDTGFKAAVNGVKTDVKNASDIFMGIPLTDGTNIIHLSFTPAGLVPGVILSLVFLALTAVFSAKPLRTDAADKVSGYVLAVLWVSFLTVLYLIPYIAFIVHQIEKRLL